MDKKAKITLLSEEEVWGDKKLEVLKKFGLKATPTDFAILTGTVFAWDNELFLNSLENYCAYSTRSISKPGSTLVNGNINDFDFTGIIEVDEDEEPVINDFDSPCTILPVLEFDDFDFVKKFSKNNSNRDTIEFGYYPQYAASLDEQKLLEKKYRNRSDELYQTSNSITINFLDFESDDIQFIKTIYKVYEYKNKYYIRVKANSDLIDDMEFTLSNSGVYKNGDYVWVEISPVEWLIDFKSKKLIAEDILLSGIYFKYSSLDNVEDYSSSFLKEYLEEYMLRDLTQEYKPSKEKELEDKNVIKEINPYGLKFDKVSEEEIIRGSIESGVAVFLHGPSSEGKSARVKQIDPDCKIIYLRNASPDSLNGKSVYNSETGEMIDVKPSWLKQLEEKCESEPDKLHVVFFDEITNALPSIQGIAFNIVLDREVNGIWKLPENARIVASGNEMKDSLAANQLAEPLFNRFAHVYIKTTVESWLKWASENGIHPAIYTFVAYKRGEVLRSEYNGERPNADPRKWEMASKMLYATSNPEMIRSLVGEEITNEFVAFCKTKVITVEDVINDSYDKEDLRSLNTSERYATVMCLSQVSEEHIEKVRNFVSLLGEEYRSIFDTLWIQNKPERLEIIAELNQGNFVHEDLDTIDEKNIEVTLLSEKDIWGNDMLGVLKKYTSIAYITDFAILTGGNYSDDVYGNHHIGYYYTRTIWTNSLCICDNEGNKMIEIWYASDDTIRPVLKLPSLFKKVSEDREYGTSEVEFGEYPQYVVNTEFQCALEDKYKLGELNKTGNSYTFNSPDVDSMDYSFVPATYDEYDFYGRKFIRINANIPKYVVLNGGLYKSGDYAWIEVKPIKWLIDEEKELLISKYGLVSGIRFNSGNPPYDSEFKITNMYKFLNDYFLKDIIQTYKRDVELTKKLTK